MGCEETREDLEEKILYARLEREQIQKQRYLLLEQYRLETGEILQTSYIPDYVDKKDFKSKAAKEIRKEKKKEKKIKKKIEKIEENIKKEEEEELKKIQKFGYDEELLYQPMRLKMNKKSRNEGHEYEGLENFILKSYSSDEDEKDINDLKNNLLDNSIDKTNDTKKKKSKINLKKKKSNDDVKKSKSNSKNEIINNNKNNNQNNNQNIKNENKLNNNKNINNENNKNNENIQNNNENNINNENYNDGIIEKIDARIRTKTGSINSVFDQNENDNNKNKERQSNNKKVKIVLDKSFNMNGYKESGKNTPYLTPHLQPND